MSRNSLKLTVSSVAGASTLTKPGYVHDLSEVNTSSNCDKKYGMSKGPDIWMRSPVARLRVYVPMPFVSGLGISISISNGT